MCCGSAKAIAGGTERVRGTAAELSASNMLVVAQPRRWCPSGALYLHVCAWCCATMMARSSNSGARGPGGPIGGAGTQTAGGATGARSSAPPAPLPPATIATAADLGRATAEPGAVVFLAVLPRPWPGSRITETWQGLDGLLDDAGAGATGWAGWQEDDDDYSGVRTLQQARPPCHRGGAAATRSPAT